MKVVDDAALQSMLDVLATPSVSGRECAVEFHETPSMHAVAPAFSRSDLTYAIELVNSMLASSGSRARVPKLTSNAASHAQEVLAKALALLVKVLQSRNSNAQLRMDAEVAQKSFMDERDRSLQQISEMKKKIAAKDAQILALQNKLDDAERLQHFHQKRIVDEFEDLRNKLTALSRREAVLMIDIKRKDVEFGKLQERVHTLLANRHAITLAQISQVPLFRDMDELAQCDQAEESDSTSLHDCPDYSSIVASSYEQRQYLISCENAQLRELLRVAHDELCYLVSAVASNARANSINMDLSVAAEQNAADTAHLTEGSVESDPVPDDELSPEQMELPLDTVRPEIEDSLANKFKWLHRQLRNAPNLEPSG